jgi:putative transcriptional regulator
MGMDKKISKGKLLVAMPVLRDPNFLQTVVLLCEHGPDGSLGLVVNRPTGVEVSSLINDLTDLSIGQTDLAGAGQIYSGGPVGRNGMLILYRGDAASKGLGIFKDVYLLTDLDALKIPERLGPAGKVRCYLGYAGWESGQLEAEIQSGAWQPMQGDSRLIFDVDPATVWQEMMRRMGRDWTIYASMPPDLSLN